MKKLLFLISLLVSSSLISQELNCRVEVVHPNIQDNDTRIYETLRRSIFEFMNNTKWTGDNFTNEERIGCSMYINVTSRPSSNEFMASIQVQSWRDAYNTNYKTTLLNFNDNTFNFPYLEFQQLEFSLNQNESNLTAILAYYAYVILALDYDSYSEMGGQKYWEAAQTIVNNAQSGNDAGWKAFDGNRNRYWLVENALNPQLTGLRKFYYTYHIKGLDALEKDKEMGRAAITEGIESLDEVHNNKPNSFLMQLLMSAKADEIVNLFKDAFPDTKSRMIEILSRVDAPNIQKYQDINKGRN